MLLKGMVFEDFTQYKVPSMFLITPNCTFKCEKECNKAFCQNSNLAKIPIITISNQKLINQYLKNPITKALVFGGLEPFDTFKDVVEFIILFRKVCNDPIIIYTGYDKAEITKELSMLIPFKNIIIKYGRFIPNQPPHYDNVLGVKLASDNQYAEKLC